jgi:hypothetical protein
LTELSNNNSATASGQFELTIQNTQDVNPFGWLDPKPVFTWTVTISLDASTKSITLTITTAYDHMNDNNALEVIAGIVAGVLTAGLLGSAILGVSGGVVSGIAVGDALTKAYDTTANNKMLDVLAFKLNQLTWIIGPIMFTASHPTTSQFVLSMKLQLDSTTFNEIEDLIHNLSTVLQLAEAVQSL